MISTRWENHWIKLRNWKNYWPRYLKYLILAIQRCILELILTTTNHNKSAILANSIMLRGLLISMVTTILKLEKY
jgi:hypothetical protein